MTLPQSSASPIALKAARASRRRHSTDRLVGWAVLGFVFGGLLVYGALNRDAVMMVAQEWMVVLERNLPAAPAAISRAMPICEGRRAQTCVIDGDTIRLDGMRIRLLDIDAPELGAPQCEEERLLALQARDRLAELLSSAPFRVVPDGTDRYGRTLARLVLEEGAAGAILVREGLAHWYGDWPDWC